MTDSDSRKVQLALLIIHRKILKRLNSFAELVSGCNFTTRTGWHKVYIDKHGVGEYRPEMRAVDALDLYYIALSDTVTLTEDQYNDYKRVVGFHNDHEPGRQGTKSTRS